MLSIIVCSRNKSLSEIFVHNIVSTVGVEYEIIHIDNSESTYSIFSAYNLGIKKSKYPYLCFIHEDVLFHTKNWGDKIIAHLTDSKTGIIGVAGGDFVPRVPASWGTLISPGNNVIQSDSSGKKTTHQFSIPKDYSFTTRSSLIIDGLFLSMRSEMTDKIRFDENLKGFHGYDYDISLQSIIAGYKNYVIYDVKVEHFSRGGTNILYFRNLILVYKKWEKYLPLIGENVTDEEFKNIHKIEVVKLLQLTKKMVRKGFETSEIRTAVAYYGDLIGYKPATMLFSLRVFLIKVFNSPKYLLKKNRIISQRKSETK